MIAQQLPQWPHRRCRCYLDRGAVAVEMGFALPAPTFQLPVLTFQLTAMTDLGRPYNAQIQLSPAAREVARLASLNATVTAAQANHGDTALVPACLVPGRSARQPSRRGVPSRVTAVTLGFPAGPPRAFCRQLPIPAAHRTFGSCVSRVLLGE